MLDMETEQLAKIIYWGLIFGSGLFLAFMLVFGIRLIRFFWRMFDRERERQQTVYVVEPRARKRAEKEARKAAEQAYYDSLKEPQYPEPQPQEPQYQEPPPEEQPPPE